MGRFSTTAKLDLFQSSDIVEGTLFRWYALKVAEKTTGELLAVFELIKIDPVKSNCFSKKMIFSIGKTG